MNQRSGDIATLPHDLDAYPSRSRTSASGGTLASSLASFFRRNDPAAASSSSAAEVAFAANEAEARQAAVQAALFRHWNAIKAEGISASQFIAFLQPLADLDGITVSYISSDEGGDECLYTPRRNEAGSLYR
ncbi:hypothetical protein [Variovorax guangxiensis]|uniref:hypothetical protein n=1 Tax=Variovorax guangxiensis TaxID=1775474 RepID=UPI00285B94DB|nr:hypothetical protein [Variovorax guangxiensis]MDR6855903.1 hypothetical protein [Variovorax guangxiensis]